MIYLIITTCINNKVGVLNFNHRENRYTQCISSALKLVGKHKIKTIIVENNGFRNTYLDNLNCDVVYTDNNKKNHIHKGVNELLDIKEVINQYNIQDDDIIIKLTGRYKLLNLNFINLVKNNSGEYDAFVKFFNVCTFKYMMNDSVLGLFAIKCKYLKDLNYDCNDSPEGEFARHVRKHININKIMEIKHELNLECCFVDNSNVIYI